MPTINKLISSWRKWINRNKTFNKKELDEMEDHLIEEIDYLMKQENLMEEEAFQKAMLDMGEREVLEVDYKKSMSKLTFFKRWIWSHPFKFAELIILLIAIIVGLSVSINFIQSTPQYTFYKLLKSIENRDYKSFSKIVNIETFISEANKKNRFSFSDEYKDKVIAIIDELNSTNKKNETKVLKPELDISINRQELTNKIYKDLEQDALKKQFQRTEEDLQYQVVSGKFLQDYMSTNILLSLFRISIKKSTINSIEIKMMPKETNRILRIKMLKIVSSWQVIDFYY